MRILWVGFLVAAFALSGAEYHDVEFARPANGAPLLLDANIPDGPGPFPAAILVHGGGWEAGDKREYIHFLFEPLTKAGIAWFSINYRLAPKHPWPAQAEDADSAIAWVKANAAKYRVDPAQLTLIGESAGGHIVSYVAARKDYGLAGVAPLYGVHDFVSRTMKLGSVGRNVTQLLGAEVMNVHTAPRLRDASPVTHVREGMPPFLMIHGTEDKGVPYSQSVEMCEKMRAFANSCELYPVAGAPHGMDHWEPNPEWHHYKKKLTDWVLDVSRRHKQSVEAAKFTFGWTHEDVEFARAGGESLRFDAAIPKGNGPFPAVILVHGGGMVRGHKRTYITPLFQPLVDAGIAWFSIDYRLAPKHRFPAAIDDVRAAVRYVRENAKKYRVDAEKIVLAGESAGGYLVSYAAGRYAKELGLRGVVDFYGLGDYFTHTVTKRQVSDSVRLFVGAQEVTADTVDALVHASPASWVNKEMAPFLFLHGTEDEQVPYEQSVQLCEEMKRVGARCEVFTVEGGRHGMGSWDRIGKPEYKGKVVEWLMGRFRGGR